MPSLFNTEISCKPTPKGVGQLKSNCPEISGSETSNKSHTLVCDTTQRVSDIKIQLSSIDYFQNL